MGTDEQISVIANTPSPVNDVQETVSQFEAKIAAALGAGERWVETSAEVIKNYNPGGLNGQKFFSYKGVLVCETGTTQACEDDMHKSLHRVIHGPNEGIRIG